MRTASSLYFSHFTLSWSPQNSPILVKIPHLALLRRLILASWPPHNSNCKNPPNTHARLPLNSSLMTQCFYRHVSVMAGIIVLPSGDSIPHTNVAPKLKAHFPWCVWQTVCLCIVYEAPFKHLQKAASLLGFEFSSSGGCRVAVTARTPRCCYVLYWFLNHEEGQGFLTFFRLGP